VTLTQFGNTSRQPESQADWFPEQELRRNPQLAALVTAFNSEQQGNAEARQPLHRSHDAMDSLGMQEGPAIQSAGDARDIPSRLVHEIFMQCQPQTQPETQVHDSPPQQQPQTQAPGSQLPADKQLLPAAQMLPQVQEPMPDAPWRRQIIYAYRNEILSTQSRPTQPQLPRQQGPRIVNGLPRDLWDNSPLVRNADTAVNASRTHGGFQPPQRRRVMRAPTHHEAWGLQIPGLPSTLCCSVHWCPLPKRPHSAGVLL
jgi:hypothetical protein